MTAYFFELFFGVLAGLVSTWWLCEHGIDQVQAWRKR